MQVNLKKKPILHISVIEMQQEAERWMYEFFSKLRESILECRVDASSENGISAEELEKYFYTYLMDKVGEAYRTCIEIHRDRINELLDKMSQQLADKLGLSNLSAVSQSTSVDRLMNDIKKKVTRSVMDVALFGTSETFPNATMSSFKNILKRKKKTDIIDITLENYDDIRANTVKDMKDAYSDLETKARARLDDIYHAQVEVGREALAQAKAMVGNNDNDKMSVIFNDACNIVDSTAKILEKYELSGD